MRTSDPLDGEIITRLPRALRVNAGKVVIHQSRNGDYRATIYASNGKALFVSSEGYRRRRDVLKALDAMGFALEAIPE